jgi:hypothetical protein
MPSIEDKILKPKQYHKMINELDIENFELKTSSIWETRITLVNLERLAEDLLEIRRSISGDMRAITLKYLESHPNPSSFLGLKKTKGAARRKSLDNKKEKELGPYKKIIQVIDDYLNQIEEIKEYIDNLKVE